MTNYTETELAEIIIDTLCKNGVEPTDDFTADSGADYGYVAAYELASAAKGYAIAWGDSGETSYAIADSVEDLGYWLISQDLSGLDLLLNRARVYGIDSIVAAPAESTNACVVLISRDFYGPHSQIRVAMEENGQRERAAEFDNAAAAFDNAAAAQAWIDRAEEDTYVLSHNESSRPTYKVVEL